MKFSVLLLACIVAVVNAQSMDSTAALANVGQKAINEALTEEEKAAAKAFWAQLTPGTTVLPVHTLKFLSLKATQLTKAGHVICSP